MESGLIALATALFTVIGYVLKLWWDERQRRKTVEGLLEEAVENFNKAKQYLADGDNDAFYNHMDQLDHNIRLRMFKDSLEGE